MLKELLNIRSFENILNVSFSTQVFKTAIINGNFELIKAIIEVIKESQLLSILPECFHLIIEQRSYCHDIVYFLLSTIAYKKRNCPKAFTSSCIITQNDTFAIFLGKVRITDIDSSFEFLFSLIQFYDLRNDIFAGARIIEDIVQHCYFEKTLGRENADDVLDFSKFNKSILVFPIRSTLSKNKQIIKLVFLKKKGLLVDMLKVETSDDENKLIQMYIKRKFFLVHMVHISTESTCCSLQELKKHYFQNLEHLYK